MVTKKELIKLRNSIDSIADIFSPNEENVQSILNWIIPDIDVNELKKSLSAYYKYLETNDNEYIKYFDPLPGLFAKYSFLTTHMKLVIKIGRQWWVYIQKYVSNPDFILAKISEKNKEIGNMLATELGHKYIAYYTERLYTFFGMYFWKFPRWHNDCGGLILYTKVGKGNLYGFQCRRCKAVISIDDIDNMTYQKRRYKIKKNN